MTFGERLQLALEYRGLKQKDLAEKIHVTDASVCRWCKDTRTPINVKVEEEYIDEF